MAVPKPKIEHGPDQTVFAWIKDQPLGDHELKLEMQAFDRLSPSLREACNKCSMNVLPRTVAGSVRLWGEEAALLMLNSMGDV